MFKNSQRKRSFQRHVTTYNNPLKSWKSPFRGPLFKIFRGSMPRPPQDGLPLADIYPNPPPLNPRRAVDQVIQIINNYLFLISLEIKLKHFNDKGIVKYKQQRNTTGTSRQHCIVLRPHYFARPIRFGSRGSSDEVTASPHRTELTQRAWETPYRYQAIFNTHRTSCLRDSP